MNLLGNLKIRQKLYLLIMVFSIALISVGCVGYFNLKQSNQNAEDLYANNLTEIQLAYENRLYIREIQGDVYGLMATTDENENKRFIDEIGQLRASFNENLTKYEQLPLGNAEKENIKVLRESIGAYREANAQIIDLAMQNKNEQAFALYQQKGQPLADKAFKNLINISENSKKNAAKMNQQSKADFAKASMIFVIITLLSIFIGVGLGLMIIKQISNRLSESVDFLGEIAAGDFSKDVSEKSIQDKSEFGTLSQAVDTMNRNIRTLIKQLSNTSEQLAAASQELTASAEQSAQASAQVAESITEVAKGAEKQLQLAITTNLIVDEMAKGIHEVTENTVDVAKTAEKTTVSATEGGKAIEKTVNQMGVIEQKTNDTAHVINELEEKSKRIGQIVELIANIAGQTNLLSLNAAIEAARAGNAGRGFAVVADEVRKLAEQSAQSTKEITELIRDVQSKTNNAVSFMAESKREVKAGAELVGLAGESFNEILQMIKAMSAEINEISSASEKLTGGTKGVVDAASTINNESKNVADQTETIAAATQEQSASMEEIASASTHLSKMATDLQDAIQKFKI